jgi:hypothetical protein
MGAAAGADAGMLELDGLTGACDGGSRDGVEVSFAVYSCAVRRHP